ncbi:MAG: extracellular solute-binding protein [Caldicoprobacterales bacterium]
MKRRMLSIVLALVLTVGLLAGCSGKPEDASNGGSDGKVEIKYWAHQNEGWNKSHNDLAKRFSDANSDITVLTEFFPYDDYESKVQTSLMAKSGGADIYELWGGWGVDFSHTGALAKVPDSIVAEFATDYFAPTYGSFEYDGAYYGVPLEFNIEAGGLLVHKRFFDEKNLKYPTTWEEMLDIAEKTSIRDGEIMEMRGFDFVTWDNVTYTWLSMTMSKGASYFDADGKLNFTTPEAIDAMTQLVSYVVDKGYTNLEALTGGGGGEGHYFLYEDQAMMVARGPWVISEGIELYELEQGVDFDYIAMPWYGSEKVFPAETGWGLAVAESSNAKDAAWKFIEFMTEPENLVGHLEICGMLPPRQSIIDNTDYKERMPHVLPLLDILENGKYIGHFNTDVLKEAVNNKFVEMCTTDISVEDALAKLEEDMNNQLFPNN